MRRAYPEGWHIELSLVVEEPPVVIAECHVTQEEDVFDCVGIYEVPGDQASSEAPSTGSRRARRSLPNGAVDSPNRNGRVLAKSGRRAEYELNGRKEVVQLSKRHATPEVAGC